MYVFLSLAVPFLLLGVLPCNCGPLNRDGFHKARLGLAAADKGWYEFAGHCLIAPFLQELYTTNPDTLAPHRMLAMFCFYYMSSYFYEEQTPSTLLRYRVGLSVFLACVAATTPTEVVVYLSVLLTAALLSITIDVDYKIHLANVKPWIGACLATGFTTYLSPLPYAPVFAVLLAVAALCQLLEFQVYRLCNIGGDVFARFCFVGVAVLRAYVD